MKAAAQSNLSHARLLTRVIEEEYRLRCDQARQQRLKHARIPEKWVMDTFPFARQPKLNKKKIMALYDSLAFLKDKQNILWMGGTGVGKTGLATSFLIRAIEQGARGRYVLFADLLYELHRSHADCSQARVIGHYGNGMAQPDHCTELPPSSGSSDAPDSSDAAFVGSARFRRQSVSSGRRWTATV